MIWLLKKVNHTNKNTAYDKLYPNINIYTVYFMLAEVIGVAREIVLKVEF